MEGGPRLIVFDCDGTLVDSHYLIVDAMGQAFDACGLPPPEDLAVRRIIGLSLAEALARLLPAGGPDKLAALECAYRDCFLAIRARGEDDAPLYPGVRAALAALDAEGYLLGVATGKALRGLHHTLDQHGLRDLFATLQTADHHPSKPHPSMLETAMAETGAAPRDTVMLGDSPFDMAMARAAGTGAIGVGWSDHELAALRAAGAGHIIDHYDELAGLLRGLKEPA